MFADGSSNDACLLRQLRDGNGSEGLAIDPMLKRVSSVFGLDEAHPLIRQPPEDRPRAVNHGAARKLLARRFARATSAVRRLVRLPTESTDRQHRPHSRSASVLLGHTDCTLAPRKHHVEVKLLVNV